jgi:hypothetical protein
MRRGCSPCPQRRCGQILAFQRATSKQAANRARAGDSASGAAKDWSAVGRILAITLGVVTAIGGYLDMSELVSMRRWARRMASRCYRRFYLARSGDGVAEMAGRIELESKRTSGSRVRPPHAARARPSRPPGRRLQQRLSPRSRPHRPVSRCRHHRQPPDRSTRPRLRSTRLPRCDATARADGDCQPGSHAEVAGHFPRPKVRYSRIRLIPALRSTYWPP